MLESKKLRALMNLVAVELPSLGVPLTGEAAELGDVRLGRGLRGQVFEKVSDQLVEVHTPALGHLPGLVGELLVERKVQGHRPPRVRPSMPPSQGTSEAI